MGRADAATALALAVACALVSLLRSTVADVGGDELWTRLVMRLPWSDVWPFIVRDGKHPPLYNGVQLVLGRWLPDTPSGLRAVSIAAAALTPAALVLFGRRLGVSPLAALAVGLWSGLHPLVLQQAINARSYALFLLVTVVYAIAVTEVLRGRRDPGRLLVVSSMCVVLVHAFGIVFIGAVLLASMSWLTFVADGGDRPLARRLARAHVPAVVACIAWFGAINLVLRNTSGLKAGLAWIDLPDNAERLYTLGGLLGSTSMSNSTRFTFGGWAILLVLLGVAARGRRTALPSIALAIAATLLPFVAQVLATGVVAQQPLWGVRHVLPTVGLAAVGIMLSLAPGVAAGWWARVAPPALALGAALSLVEIESWPTTMLQDVAEHYRAAPAGTALRVGYAYGNLGSLNYYLDRRCLDDFQFRVIFPDVRGPADATTRSAFCVAQPIGVPLRPGEERVLLVHRPFRPEELRMRDSVLKAGWEVRYRFLAPRQRIVAELLTRP